MVRYDIEKFVEQAKKLYERAKLSDTTSHLDFRIPYIVKLRYMVLPAEKKRLVKQVLIETINRIYEAEEDARSNNNVNININVNMVKAEARAETNIVVDRRVIKELVEWLERIQNLESKAYPKGLMKAIEKALPEVKKLLQP